MSEEQKPITPLREVEAKAIELREFARSKGVAIFITGTDIDYQDNKPSGFFAHVSGKHNAIVTSIFDAVIRNKSISAIMHDVYDALSRAVDMTQKN